ncbi:M14 family metallopeptidase [Kitasatospora sp. NBC_00240]|uniref:M14 family metallopeptidase n=1 Tax=Kitasatospora sp. NBC_00240 TaxID=2903567 RepID=UPI00225884C7|nr:M14 family metallopeptidase [Kitasatospora sp. NBC_00240]MCX5214584.1 M14 family metallopeptidase [Kitasatospora sp. NBC_00240]
MSYLNVTEVESAVVSLATAFPSLTRLIALPEPSVEGRRSHALLIGAESVAPKDSCVLTGGLHAREWGSCEILVHLAADLLEAYQGHSGLAYGGTAFTADQVRRLLNGLDLVVFPLVNPDGRRYSQALEPMWRKNRDPAASGGDPARIGVDINRNFDFLFDFTTAFAPTAGPRVSTDPLDEVYQGPRPFSEPETRNVAWLFDALPRTRWYVDVHSHAQDMLYVWGDDENQSVEPDMNFRNPAFDGARGAADDLDYAEFLEKGDADTALLLAARFCQGLHGVRGRTYKPMSAFHLYPTSGTSDDYAFSRHLVDPDKGKILAFTIEWGEQFQPPWAEMERIILDVDAGLVQFCLAAI